MYYHVLCKQHRLASVCRGSLKRGWEIELVQVRGLRAELAVRAAFTGLPLWKFAADAGVPRKCGPLRDLRDIQGTYRTYCFIGRALKGHA